MTHLLDNPCEYAKERHKNFLLWLNLWTILLFVFGVAVILFLIAAIFLFIKESWLPGALTTLSTIASGTAVGWVVKRRQIAKEDEQEAYKDVIKLCDDSSAVDALRGKMSIFGQPG